MSHHRYAGLSLPYYVSGMFVGIAMSRLQSAGVWDDLPEELQQKISTADAGVTITEEDLDPIDDDTLAKMRETLGV